MAECSGSLCQAKRSSNDGFIVSVSDISMERSQKLQQTIHSRLSWISEQLERVGHEREGDDNDSPVWRMFDTMRHGGADNDVPVLI